MKVTIDFEGSSIIIWPDLSVAFFICTHTGQTERYSIRELYDLCVEIRTARLLE